MSLRRFSLYAAILCGVLFAYQGVHAQFQLPDFDKIIQPILEQPVAEPPQVCVANSRFICQCDSRLWGYAFCNAQGTDIGPCENSCSYMNDEAARAALLPASGCNPGTKRACACLSQLVPTYGAQLCNAAGSAWGSCNLSCTYRTLNEAMVNLVSVHTCTPNTSRACKCPTNQKWGYQTCYQQGTSYGKCINSCTYAYPSQVVLPKLPTLNPDTINTLLNIFAQQQAAGNVCAPNTKRACSCASAVPGQPGLPGQQTCKVDGSGYGACGNCGLVNLNIIGGVQPQALPVAPAPAPAPAPIPLPVIDPNVIKRVIDIVSPQPLIISPLIPSIPQAGQQAPAGSEEGVIDQRVIDLISKPQLDSASLKRVLDAISPAAPEQQAEAGAVLPSPGILDALRGLLGGGNSAPSGVAPEQEASPAQAEQAAGSAPLMADVIENLLGALGAPQGAGVNAAGSADLNSAITEELQDLLAAYSQQQSNLNDLANGVTSGLQLPDVDVDQLEQLAKTILNQQSKGDPSVKNIDVQKIQELVSMLRQNQAAEAPSTTTRAGKWIFWGAIGAVGAAIVGLVVWLMM